MSYLYNIFLDIAPAWGGDYSLCKIRLSTRVVGWKGVCVGGQCLTCTISSWLLPLLGEVITLCATSDSPLGF